MGYSASVTFGPHRPLRTQRTLFCLLAAPHEDPPIYLLLLLVALIVLWLVATATTGAQPLSALYAPLTPGTQRAGVEMADPIASREDDLGDKDE